MGLDANAGFLNPKQKQPDNVVDLHDDFDDRKESPFHWRKHARLQQFMMELHDEKNDGPKKGERVGMMNSFNCEPMLLTREDVLRLQKCVQNDSLPFCPDGFFWGHQFQEESMREYKQQDLEFCEQALKWIDEGKEVFYECWW